MPLRFKEVRQFDLGDEISPKLRVAIGNSISPDLTIEQTDQLFSVMSDPSGFDQLFTPKQKEVKEVKPS